MKIDGWSDEQIAAEARALVAHPVLSALLSTMEANATTKIITQSLSDDAALRNAAIELKVIRDVRIRLAQLARKDVDHGQ